MDYLFKRYLVEENFVRSYDENGFIKKPYGSLSIDEINELQCLIIIGEAFSGKSVFLEQSAVEVSEENKTFIQLSGVIDSNYENKINNSIFNDWLKRDDESKFYIYLDALEEGRLVVKSIAILLSNTIKEIPSNKSRNLYLRITCRDSDWIDFEIIHNKLRQKFPNKVYVKRLLPLTEDVISDYLKHKSFDSEKIKEFYEELYTKDLIPISSLPFMLIKLSGKFENEEIVEEKYYLYKEIVHDFIEEKNSEIGRAHV